MPEPTRFTSVVLLVLRVVERALFSKIVGLEMGSEAYVHALFRWRKLVESDIRTESLESHTAPPAIGSPSSHSV